jgi:hypothetical protein
MFSVRALLPLALAFSMLGLAGIATVPSQSNPGPGPNDQACPPHTYFHQSASGAVGCCPAGTVCS